MKMRTLRFLIILLITFLSGYYFGVSKIAFEWRNYKPHFTVSSKQPPSPNQNLDFSMFWTVFDKLQNSYYDKKLLDSQKILNGAITGMVQSLDDPYTVFLPPVQNSDFKQGLAGQFEGIGAELGLNGKQIIVVAPLTGSPAEKAGIKPADAILKVNDESTAGWTLSQAVEKIRGPKGTEVVLTIMHKGENNPVTIRVKRDTITVKSVEGWIKSVKDIEKISKTQVLKTHPSDKVVYVRLAQFGDNTNKEWLNLVNDFALKIKQDKNIKGLILDLRNNPGGYLPGAQFIVSEFIKAPNGITPGEQQGRSCSKINAKGEGVVVIQENDTQGDFCFYVSRVGLLTDVPLIVLLNKGSASASEIVAGALRDYNRAKLVGETSFGKGTIQEASELGNGAGLHITIAKWLTPNGTWVHGKGLTPDVQVTLDSKDQTHDSQLEKAVEELVR